MVLVMSVLECLVCLLANLRILGVRLGRGVCEGVVSSMSVLCFLKYVTSLLPRSCPMMGHRSPFVFWSSCYSSRKVLLCRLVLSIVVYLQPPRMCVCY